MNIKKKILAVALVSACAVAAGYAKDVEVVSAVEASRTVDGNTDLHITSATAPVADGVTIDLVSEDAGLFFDNLSPQEVIDNYAASILVDGKALDVDVNGRVSIYRQGTLVMAHPAGFEPLATFVTDDFTGESAGYATSYYYSNAPAPEVAEDMRRPLADDDAIRSMRLKRGYMATLATEPDGMGYSRVFIADDGDLEVKLPVELAGKVSFIRVFKWEQASKKGWVGGNSQVDPPEGYLEAQCDVTRSTWVYSWSDNPDYGRSPEVQGTPWRNQEFVPMKWGAGGDWSLCFNEPDAAHFLSYNEPDHTEQSNVSVSTAIAEWPKHLQTGRRLGSPATTDFNWIYNFMSECRRLNYRVDYVAIHAYWGGRGSSVVCSTVDDWYKALKEVHEKTGRPLWITEWNNGANWTHEGWPDTEAEQKEKQRKFITEILAMMDTCSFIERYSIYNWVEEKRSMFWQNLNLTPAGQVYSDFDAAMAFDRRAEVIPTWSVREAPVLFYVFDRENGSVILSWDDVNREQVDEYVVEKSVAGSAYEEVARTSYPQLSYSDKIEEDLNAGDAVLYRVKAYVGDKEETVSNVVRYNSMLTSADTPIFGKVTIDAGTSLYAFGSSYGETAPIMVLGTQTYRMKTPMLPRMNALDGSSCEFGVSMWDYNAGQTFVSKDTLSYMIMPKAGDYDFGGLEAKAGRVDGVGREVTRVQFDAPFASASVVLATAVNVNNQVPVVARVYNVDENGFDLFLQCEEAYTGELEPEAVNYVALSQGEGSIGDLRIKVGVTGDGAVAGNGSSPVEIAYGADYGDACFFSGFQSLKDNLTATLRATQISGNFAGVFKSRETSASNQRVVAETVGWCVIEGASGTSGVSGITGRAAVPVYDTVTDEIKMSDGSEMSRVCLYSLAGQLLGSTNTRICSFSLGSLPEGMYIAKVNGTQSLKIAKK